MKVEIHDLKHEKWFLEAEPSITVGELKKINLSERSLDESSNQKMIYSGKILKDTDTLESINYAEGKGFIVCMVSKSRKPAAPKPQQPAAPATSKSKSPETEQPKTGNASNNSTDSGAAGAGGVAGGATAAPVSEQPLTGPSALATGSQLNSIVNNIMDMGYSRQQVVKALRRAYNNPDRAVEYLVTGQVPEEPETEPEEATSAATAAAAPANEGGETKEGEEDKKNNASASGTPAGDASTIDRNLFDAAEEREMDEEEIVGEEEDIDFHELLGLDDDQLNELRTAVRQNPQELLRLLDPLVRNNPQVAETLVNNLDQFMWFLQSTGGDGELLEQGDASEMAVEPGTQQIALAPEEEQAIYRLMELGFEFDVVALAYLACDKDEQLTANYLLEHGHED